MVMYWCESWIIKKTECWRIDAFELWCWRRLLRVPWTAGRSNQSILKEINPEYSLEGLMMILKLQYFDLLMWRADSLENALMLGGIESQPKEKRATEDEVVREHHWLNGPELEQTPGDSGGQRDPGMLQSMGSQRVRHDLNNNNTLLITEEGLIGSRIRLCDVEIKRQDLPQISHEILEKLPYVSELQFFHL